MNNGKHIAVICNYQLKPDRIGGMDRFFKAYNDELIQNGHEITWFFSGGERFDFYSGFELHIAGQQESVEAYSLNSLEKKNNIDIVVTHFLPLCTPFYKKIKDVHNPYIIAVDHNPRPLKGFSLKKRIKNKLKGIFYSRFIDCFVGVSKYTANCILQDYGSNLRKKTQVVYNGIDTTVYIKRKEKNFGKFVVTSHLRESKGIQDLILAINSLSAQNKKLLSIDIYGEGPMEGELKEMVKTKGLEQQIDFKGSSSKLPELLQRYSFLLQPTYMECFSLSILESLAANVPVVTTPVGGNTEVITSGENGYIFLAGDIENLKNLLEKILQRDLKIENNVSTFIEQNFPIEKMVEGHLKLLPCT